MFRGKTVHLFVARFLLERNRLWSMVGCYFGNNEQLESADICSIQESALWWAMPVLLLKPRTPA